MWSGSEKINNFKTYCDFWRELEERGTFSKVSAILRKKTGSEEQGSAAINKVKEFLNS